jgi:hypothetical protein
VTDPMEIAQVVLARLGELLRKLPPELLTDLYEGAATLEIVPKGGRPARAPATRAQPAKPQLDAGQVKIDLDRINDRAAATTYLNDLRLTVAQVKALAKELGITVASKAKKDDAIHEIVRWTVGQRLQSDAISRPAPSRF